VGRGSQRCPDSEVPIAIGQEASPAEMYRQTKRVAELMGERALGVELELEFELIQTRMAQKPLLRVEIRQECLCACN